MSFCRLCGAGFEFVGEHRPGCEAVTPKPPAAPELPEGFHARVANQLRAQELPDGWTNSYPGGVERRSRNISVDCDADGITTEEHATGYGGYTSTVWVPMTVLRALLATQGLSIVDAKDRAVLEACAALDEMTPDFWADNTDDILLVRLGKAELARREKS
jgi:hypothetical protein